MKYIYTLKAPKAIGPYSQAVVSGSSNTLYVSGQLPIDPKTMTMVQSDIKKQTLMCLTNLKAVLEASGLTLNHVVKTTCFLSDMAHFKQFNEIYSEFFDNNYPARSCYEVSRLPNDSLVEIEAIAAKE